MDELKNEAATNSEMAPETMAEADGYYGEEDMDAEELDLSFLDEEEGDERADDAKVDTSK